MADSSWKNCFAVCIQSAGCHPRARSQSSRARASSPLPDGYRRYLGIGPRQMRTVSLGYGTRTEQSGTSTVPVDRYHQTIG